MSYFSRFYIHMYIYVAWNCKVLWTSFFFMYFMEISRTLNKEKCLGWCFIFWMVSMQWLTFSSFYNITLPCHRYKGNKGITCDWFKAKEIKKSMTDSLLSAISLRCIFSFYKSMLEIRIEFVHLLRLWRLNR